MANDGQPAYADGKICYVEVPCFDAGASSAFYNAVFGWEMRTRGDGEIAFNDTVNQVSGAFVPGRSPGKNTGLLIYIMVDDIHATIDALLANGGQLLQPIGLDAPEITARFSDPAGNVWGLYQQPTS